jgi:hypothetical protein
MLLTALPFHKGVQVRATKDGTGLSPTQIASIGVFLISVTTLISIYINYYKYQSQITTTQTNACLLKHKIHLKQESDKAAADRKRLIANAARHALKRTNLGEFPKVPNFIISSKRRAKTMRNIIKSGKLEHLIMGASERQQTKNNNNIKTPPDPVLHKRNVPCELGADQFRKKLPQNRQNKKPIITKQSKSILRKCLWNSKKGSAARNFHD